MSRTSLGESFLFFRKLGNLSQSLSLQEIITMPDANLTRSVMHFFDCFLDDFYDDKYMSVLSELDIRAQVEVKNYIIHICKFFMNIFN